MIMASGEGQATVDTVARGCRGQTARRPQLVLLYAQASALGVAPRWLWKAGEQVRCGAEAAVIEWKAVGWEGDEDQGERKGAKPI